MSFLSALFGGDSSSSSSATTQSDNRNILGQEAAYIGAGGSQDKSVHLNTTNSTALTTTWADSSNKNSNNVTVDSSSRNTSIINTTVDGGSLDLAAKTVVHSYKFGEAALAFGTHALDDVTHVADSALIANNNVATTALTANANNFTAGLQTLAASFSGALSSLTRSEASTQASNSSAFQSASNQIQTAYADAKGRGANTDKMMMLALVVAGVIAFRAVSK